MGDGDALLPDDVLASSTGSSRRVHVGQRQDPDRMTERLAGGGVEHPHVDVIGHPSGRMIGKREAVRLRRRGA